MTILARRLYYSLACLVFFIAAPMIILPAAGYQWAGWRLGFLKTGVVVVTVTPKATVRLNEHSQGSLTKMTKRLLPGQYALSLRRPGYRSWQTLIRIEPNTASLIGPVMLFPETFGVVDRGPTWSGLLVDQWQQFVTALEPQSSGWILQQVWPKRSSWTVSYPTEPQALSVSPRQRVMVVTAGQSSFITTLTPPTTTWTIPAVSDVFWSDRGEAVFYARRDQQLVLIDSLAETEAVVAAGSSFGWLDHELWLTEASDGKTRLARQNPDTGRATTVQELVGAWRWQAGPTGVLILRNQEDRETLVYDSAAAHGRSQPILLGPVDQLWWPDRQTPPLWHDGPQLYTLNADGRPLLLERQPRPYQAAYWVVPFHILLSSDGQRLSIRSVSSRQGRGPLLEQSFADPITLLNVNRGRKTLLLQQGSSPTSLLTLSW